MVPSNGRGWRAEELAENVSTRTNVHQNPTHSTECSPRYYQFPGRLKSLRAKGGREERLLIEGTRMQVKNKDKENGDGEG